MENTSTDEDYTPNCPCTQEQWDYALNLMKTPLEIVVDVSNEEEIIKAKTLEKLMGAHNVKVMIIDPENGDTIPCPLSDKQESLAIIHGKIIQMKRALSSMKQELDEMKPALKRQRNEE